MSLVKSFSVDNGDMFYIRHGSDNFTIIDCSLPDDRRGSILAELKTQSKGKGVRRFISTHPDQDHLSGLLELDEHLPITNFYCVKNKTTKSPSTADFDRYVKFRDGANAFHVHKGCSRKWMNVSDNTRGSAGLNILRPVSDNPNHLSALKDAANGLSPNNISCIVQYKMKAGASVLWMGDLETDFMEKIESNIALKKVNILFAPHHGRASGKVPDSWLKKLDPDLIVIGEAPSQHLNYYSGYNTITQNTTGDILFDLVNDRAHVFVSNNSYAVDHLHDDGLDHSHGLYYLGSLHV